MAHLTCVGAVYTDVHRTFVALVMYAHVATREAMARLLTRQCPLDIVRKGVSELIQECLNP